MRLLRARDHQDEEELGPDWERACFRAARDRYSGRLGNNLRRMKLQAVSRHGNLVITDEDEAADVARLHFRDESRFRLFRTTH